MTKAVCERCPGERSPVIVGKFNQAGLHNQTTELDQVARSLAATHDPIPPITTRSFQQKTVA